MAKCNTKLIRTFAENINVMDCTLNIKGRLLSLSAPVVMGILNCTPDSFFAGSRKQTEKEIADRANQIVAEGGSIIDVGAFSTRPGASEVSQEEEMNRLRHALPIVAREQPGVAISVDTYRPDVARMAVEEYGADIINDVSEGGITGIVDKPLEERYDVADGDERFKQYPAIFRMMGRLKVPTSSCRYRATSTTCSSISRKRCNSFATCTSTTSSLTQGTGSGRRRKRTSPSSATSASLRCWAFPSSPDCRASD